MNARRFQARGVLKRGLSAVRAGACCSQKYRSHGCQTEFSSRVYLSGEYKCMDFVHDYIIRVVSDNFSYDSQTISLMKGSTSLELITPTADAEVHRTSAVELHPAIQPLYITCRLLYLVCHPHCHPAFRNVGLRSIRQRHRDQRSLHSNRDQNV